MNNTAAKLIADLVRIAPDLLTPRTAGAALVERAAEALSAAYDSRFGGLGRAPKFPNSMVFSLFLRAFRALGPAPLSWR